MLPLEERREQLRPHGLAHAVGSDALVPRPFALLLVHALGGALVLAHAHSGIGLVAEHVVVVDELGLGCGREQDELLGRLGRAMRLLARCDGAGEAWHGCPAGGRRVGRERGMRWPSIARGGGGGLSRHVGGAEESGHIA